MKKFIITIVLSILFLGVFFAIIFERQSSGQQLFKKHSIHKSPINQEETISQRIVDIDEDKMVLDDLVSVWTEEEIEAMNYSRDKSFKHKCVHDSIVDKNEKYEKKHSKIINKLNSEKVQKHKETSSWQPIRFHVNFENIEKGDIPQKDVDFIKNKLIPAAKAYFETTFNVQRLTQPIIPSKYYTQYGKLCNGETPVPKSLYSGVDNADMVMMITAKYAPNETYLAYASKCYQGEQELKSLRPTMGFFLINAAYLEKSLNANRWFTWIETSIHEMMHAMGFSKGQFQNFQNGKIGLNSAGQYFFMGPKTVNYGKLYYKCNNVNGVPIEQNGSSGSAGSHWERVALGNEGMTASDFGDAVFSEFTLKLFEDSGWYTYNEGNAQQLVWEKGAGCNTMQGFCDKASFEHSCTEGIKGCNFDYSARGICVSGDTFAPNCPYYAGYSNGHCEYDTFNANLSNNLGGEVSTDARCWVVTSQNQYSGEVRSACYKSRCSGEKLEVFFFNKWYTCEQNGQIISQNGISIRCPPKVIFCSVESDCPNSCTAQGTCVDGKCNCYNGYAGTDCQRRSGQKNQKKTSSETNLGNGTRPTSSGSQTYCLTSRGDYLGKYQNKYYCCNKEEGKCCGIYQYPKYGYCYCLPGYVVNSLLNVCELKH